MVEINLLPEELKARAKTKKTGVVVGFKPEYAINFIPLIFGILICAHIFLGIVSVAKSNQYRILNSQWKKLEPQRKLLESFNKENTVFSESAKAIQQLTEQRLSWAEKLNRLSACLPAGIWFNDLSVSNKDLVLQASVISLQKDEMNLIAKFIENLKNDAGFFKGFSGLELGPVQHRTVGSYDIADFILTATFKAK